MTTLTGAFPARAATPLPTKRPVAVVAFAATTPPAQTTTELQLVRACLRGDPRAMRQLVEAFQFDVYGVCVRLLGDRHEAEDVGQEVFLRVFRSLRRWDPSRPLRPWIIGITINRCRTFLARRARRPQPSEHLPQVAAPAPAQDHSPELLREIRSALGELRDEYRSVFVLFHEQGLSYELIAQAMTRSVGTIKTWLHRARQQVLHRLQLRGMVSEDGHALP
jgi:RNA polymerase sigma-70 factor (ECF subfamily)